MPYRGRPNASYLVPLTVRAMAEVRGDDLEALCAAIDATTEAAFGGRLVGAAAIPESTSPRNRSSSLRPPGRRYRLCDCWPGSGSIRGARGRRASRDPRSHFVRPWVSALVGALAPEAREYDVRRIVRSRSHSSAGPRRLLAGLVAVVALAVAGTTVGYAALSKSVTLTARRAVRGRSPPSAAPSATSSPPRASRSATTTWCAPASTRRSPTAARSASGSAGPLELTVDGDDPHLLGDLHQRRRRPRRDRPRLPRRRALGQPRRRHRPRRHGPRGGHPEDA